MANKYQRDFLISLKFKTEDITGNIDKIYSSIKSLQTAFSSQNLDMPTVEDGEKPFEYINKLVKQLNESINDVNSTFSITYQSVGKITNGIVELSQAFGDLSRKVTTFDKNGNITESMQPANAAKNIFGDNITAEEAISKQTEIYTTSLEELGDKTSKTLIKMGIQDAIKQMNDEVSSALKGNLEDIEKYVSDIQVIYDKNGKATKSYVTLMIDQYNKLKIGQEYKDVSVDVSGNLVSGTISTRIQNSASTNLERQRSDLLKEQTSLYKELFDIQKKMMSLDDTHQNEIDYLKEKKSQIESQIVSNNNLIQTEQKYQLLQDKEIALQDEYIDKLSKFKAVRADSQDTQRINSAIKAYQELKQAEIDLQKTKESGKASADTMQKEVENVNRLRNAVNQYEQTLLSNGKAIGQVQSYTEAKTKADREADIAISKLNDGIGRNTTSLNTISGSFARVTENVIKYNLAQFGLVENLQRVIQTVKELDEAMTNIRLVTGESAESARETMNSYSALAQELGATTIEVAEGKRLPSLNSFNCGKLLRALITKSL